MSSANSYLRNYNASIGLSRALSSVYEAGLSYLETIDNEVSISMSGMQGEGAFRWAKRFLGIDDNRVVVGFLDGLNRRLQASGRPGVSYTRPKSVPKSPSVAIASPKKKKPSK